MSNLDGSIVKPTGQDDIDSALFVTETAPSQRKRGRPQGVKNGEGQNPSGPKVTLTDNGVTCDGFTLADNGAWVYNRPLISATELAEVGKIAAKLPQLPSRKPEELEKWLEVLKVKTPSAIAQLVGYLANTNAK